MPKYAPTLATFYPEAASQPEKATRSGGQQTQGGISLASALASQQVNSSPLAADGQRRMQDQQKQRMAAEIAARQAARGGGNGVQGLALPPGLYGPVNIGQAAPVNLPGGGWAQSSISDEEWAALDAAGDVGAGRVKPSGLDAINPFDMHLASALAQQASRPGPKKAAEDTQEWYQKILDPLRIFS